MRVRSWQGVREQGASEAGAVPPAGNGFLAGFTVSVPGRPASPAGLGKAKVGSCFSHLLLPSVLLAEAGSASAEEVNRVGGAAPLPRQGFPQPDPLPGRAASWSVLSRAGVSLSRTYLEAGVPWKCTRSQSL